MNGESTIQDLFSQSVARHGPRTAIEVGPRHISYQALDLAASDLAQTLRAGGLQQEVVVAILLEDIVDIVTTIMACLKVNCIFAPLDPHHPPKRLQTIFDEIHPDWLISRTPYRDVVDSLPAVPHVRFLDKTNGRYEPAPVTVESASDKCYLYFTSGSTGRPKAILGSHRGLRHFIEWEIKTFQVDHTFRFSQLTPPFFDPFLRDILVPLCAGATICVPTSKEILLNPTRLTAWINDNDISLMHIIPTLFRAITQEALTAEHFQALRHVLIAGEPLFTAEINRWMNVFGQRIQLFNLYGPTETTLAKFFHPITVADKQGHIIPVGKPIEGAAAIILDQEGNLCPPGTIGEIHIRTPFRSHGYYNRPDLTSTVFIPNPFSTDANDLIYKTGDMGRLLENGVFELLGRRDFQIKIAGTRIELGEVENLLRQQEVIKDAVVIDKEGGDNQKYLLAFIVSDTEQTDDALRTSLSEYLPEAMIPMRFIQLDEFPQTLNGKINRRALQELSQRADSEAEHVPPGNEVEQTLVEIWQTALEIEPISVMQNLFTLGAHSLMITKVLYKINQALGTELPLRFVFDQPTIAGQAKAIYEILADDPLPSTCPPLEPAPREMPLALSFAQQRLWFLDQLTPENPAYNIFTAVRLQGQLLLAALDQSLNEIVQRHETLRTNFETIDGKPVQIIRPDLTLNMPVIDLQHLPEAQREKKVYEVAAQEAERPFNLATDPLIRVQLLRLAAEEHVILLTLHHIIADGWSMGIFVQEMAALYDAYTRDLPTPLPPLAVQYADYAQWQRQWLPLAEQLQYWQEQLAAAPAILNLPTDFPRPRQPSFHGGKHDFTIPAAVVKSLKQISQEAGATLFMSLTAAFNILLYRLSRQTDIVIGTPIANRTQAAVEQVIGFFVNTLALRTDLSGQPNFRELLARVRETTLEAYAHQDLPFEKLVEEVQPERSLSHTPLFQVMFVYDTVPRSPLHIPNLTLTPLETDETTVQFDLTMRVWDMGETIAGSLEYSTDLFRGETVRRIAGYFQTLLAGIAGQPDQSITRLPLLSPLAQQALLAEGITTPFPVTDTLPQRFQAQVNRTPEAEAVTAEGVTLTYRQLNQRANQLAHYLQAHGVGPDTPVALCLERSLDLVVGLLGILKAGGAYLPLDLAYPPERLAFMLADAQAPLLLTQAHLQPRFQESGVTTICVDADQHHIEQQPVHNPDSALLPEHLAYIIYTSGSTGKPKGTLVTQANVCRLFDATAAWFQFNQDDVWTLFHAYAFDFSVWELWGALLFGGRLVVVPYLTSRDPGAFLNLLQAEQVTVLNQTPSAFNQLLRVISDRGAPPLALRLVIFGGEALDIPALAPWYDAYGPQAPTLVNMYGITETTVHVTYRPLSAEDVSLAGGSLIGSAIPDLGLYLLDADFQPVPPGVAGELFVAGGGLARGYLGRAALTAQRFIPHPFPGTPAAAGGRLYRTGDLVRRLTTGELEYLGRSDHQVKLRGFRIELGEIEATLSRHPAVAHSLVVVQTDEHGADRLVAYLVPAETELPAHQLLQQWLKDTLPDYMVPAVYVSLPRFPLTPNGKIDRRALPLPDTQRPDLSHSYQPPRHELEAVLADIWAEVLGLDRVGVFDNFFDLGGHSLIAVQILARLREIFPVALPLSTLFESITVAELATNIEQICREAQIDPFKLCRILIQINQLSEEEIQESLLNPDVLLIRSFSA